MQNELRKKAEQKVKAKTTMFVLGIIFAFSALVLMILSFAIPSIAFWLWIAIGSLGLSWGFIYIMAVVLPFSVLSKERHEEEVEMEYQRMQRNLQYRLPPAEDLSEEDKLELKELERLQKKWAQEDDLV